MRLRVELSQLRQDHGVAIAPTDVPGFMPRAKVFRHSKHVLQCLEVRFEMQKLTILMEAVQRRRMFVVEVLEEGKVEQPGCWPVGYGILDDDGPRRVGIRFELLSGQVGQDNWSLNS